MNRIPRDVLTFGLLLVLLLSALLIVKGMGG